MRQLLTSALLLILSPLLSKGPGAQALTRQEMLLQAEEYILSEADSDRFSGTLLIAKGEERLLEIPLGEASKRFGVPIDMQTKFNLGSMNKMFTAVGIMQLREAGKLALSDPLSKFVDESWLPKSTSEQISLQQLLNHTSGLGSYFNPTFFESSRLLFSELEDYKPLVQGDTLAFEPGTSYAYSNTGMLLLGVVIEQASGENYFDFMRQRIFEPAAMKHTDSYFMNQPVKNLAIGYIRDPSVATGWRNNLYDHVLRGGPAGGGFSTVGDLQRFALALTGGKLVSAASRELLWSDPRNQGYGSGFGIQTLPSGERVVGHSGGFPGVNGNLDIFLESGYIVAVLTNYDQAASRASEVIRGLIGRVVE